MAATRAMSLNKAHLLLLALGTLTVSNVPFSAANSNNSSHDLVLGTRQAGDISVYCENINIDFSLAGVVTVQKSVNTTDNMSITQVKCLDQVADGTGAYPLLLGGGPGYTWVALSFQSQWWRGIYFSFEIFAKPSS